MKLSSDQINKKLKDAGLRVTPQRQAILEAVHSLGNHPTAEMIIDYIRINNPAIATGTVYNVLDVLVENGLVQRVKTDKDAMRYDAIMKKHHHIYCAETERIEDFFDEELDQLLQTYFQKKNLPNFKIEDIILHINGSFNEQNK